MLRTGEGFGYYFDQATGVDKSIVSLWDGDKCICYFPYGVGETYLRLMASFYGDKLLSKCSVEDLKEELKRRGYSGTITKNETVEI